VYSVYAPVGSVTRTRLMLLASYVFVHRFGPGQTLLRSVRHWSKLIEFAVSLPSAGRFKYS
jgi:hypothetical protein